MSKENQTPENIFVDSVDALMAKYAELNPKNEEVRA